MSSRVCGRLTLRASWTRAQTACSSLLVTHEMSGLRVLPAPLEPARLRQLVADRIDQLDRQLEELGQQAGGDGLHGDDEDGLDGPGLG